MRVRVPDRTVTCPGCGTEAIPIDDDNYRCPAPSATCTLRFFNES